MRIHTEQNGQKLLPAQKINSNNNWENVTWKMSFLPLCFKYSLPFSVCWNTNINQTVPCSVFKPHSPLYQSKDPAFLTEITEGPSASESDQRIRRAFCYFIIPPYRFLGIQPTPMFISCSCNMDTDLGASATFFSQLDISPYTYGTVAIKAVEHEEYLYLIGLRCYIGCWGIFPQLSTDKICFILPILNVHHHKPLFVHYYSD